MKKRVFRALAAVGLAGAMAAAVAAPAGAGLDKESILPTLTVTKVVVAGENAYDIPNSALFSIQVSCNSFDEPEDSFVDVVTFNGDGSTHSAPGGWADNGNSWTLAEDWDLKRATCTVTELAGGAAQYLAPGAPTYACSFTTEQYINETLAGSQAEEPDEPGCLGDNVVHLGSPWDKSCIAPEELAELEGSCLCIEAGVITVTNTIADDPAKVLSGAVTVTPKFAG